ncbi:MAG: hypothetical protein JWO78_1409 [Micavibrio sp.]|nr:hypothetical protein [Micavibrio sp.]
MTLELNTHSVAWLRIAGLDSLRGLAILMVILSHFVPEIFPGLSNGFIGGLLGAMGGGGVLLFFYLSGFLIYRNVQAQTPAVFLLRRFFKLFPAYWINIAVICLIALLFKTGVAIDPKTILSNLLMVQEFTHSSLLNAAFWTLQIEVKFYLIIVAFHYFCGAKRVYWLMAALLLINIALFPVLHRGSTLITYLIIFFPGIAAARGYAAGWNPTAYREMAAVTAIASLNALAFLNEIHVHMAIYALVHGAAITLILNKEFRSQIMSFFGKVSYSHYLYHAAIGFPLILWLKAYATGPVQLLVLFVLVFSVTTAIATLSFYAVERPSIVFGHALEARLARSRNNLLGRLFQKQSVRIQRDFITGRKLRAEAGHRFDEGRETGHHR